MATNITSAKLHVGLSNSSNNVEIFELSKSSILINDAKHAVINFDVDHDRVIHSWFCSQSQQITSPVRYHSKDDALIGIINKQKLCKWKVTNSGETIDKLKKSKLPGDVYTLVQGAGGEVPYILYTSGGVSGVDSPSDAVIKSTELPGALRHITLTADTVITCNSGLLDDETHITCLIIRRTNKKLRSTLTEGDYSLLIYKVAQSAPDGAGVFHHRITHDSGDILAYRWCMMTVNGQLSLLALGCPGELYRIRVTDLVDESNSTDLDLSHYKLPHTFTAHGYTLPTAHHNVCVRALSSHNIIVVAGVCKPRTVDKSYILVYDVVYDVVITEMTMPHPLDAEQQVYVCSDRVYHTSRVGSECAVMMYDCSDVASPTLASMLTQHEYHHTTNRHTSITWNVETNEDTVMTDTTQGSSFDKLLHLLDTKSPSYADLRRECERVMSGDTSVSCSMSLGDDIVTRMVNNPHILTTCPSLTHSLISHLLTRRTITNRCMKSCMKTLAASHHFNILYHVIFDDDDKGTTQTRLDLDDELIVVILKTLLNVSSVSLRITDPVMSPRTRSYKPVSASQQPMEDGNRERFINKFLQIPFNTGLVIPELRQQMDISDVKALFQHITNELKGPNVQDRLLKSDQGKQLCDWLTCLIDSNFLNLVVATDLYETLLEVKECVDLQIDYMSELDNIDHLLKVVECRSKRREKQKYTDYRIEIIEFT